MSQNTGVIIVMLALAGWPPPVHAQPVPVRAAPPAELSFEKRWQPESFPAGALEIRTNTVRTFPVTRQVEGMIPGAAPILPTHAFIPDETTARLKSHQDVSIRVDAPLPPERPVAQKVAPKTQKVSKRVAVLDICQRHGMHKQVTNGGKSWRCRR